MVHKGKNYVVFIAALHHIHRTLFVWKYGFRVVKTVYLLNRKYLYCINTSIKTEVFEVGGLDWVKDLQIKNQFMLPRSGGYKRWKPLDG